MTPKQRLLAALRREQPDRVPTFEWFIDDRVAQALTGTTDPIEVVERLELDAVNVRADYQKTWHDESTYADEWGVTKRLTGDVLPAAMHHPIADLSRQADYVFPDPAAPGRFDTLEAALSRFGDERAVVFNVRDGFSDVRDLLGYQDALMGVLLDKANYRSLLLRCVDYNVELARLARQRYGIEIVATTDDVCTAQGPLFSPAAYEEVILPCFRAAIAGFRDQGLLVIKHCDGDVRSFLAWWLDAGIDCLDPIDPGGGLDMGQVKRDYGHRICLKGNIDCTGNLCNGTPEAVREEVRQCIAHGAPGGGFIVSSSNTIHRGVRPENYRAMLDAVKQLGCYEDLGEESRKENPRL